LKTYLETRHGSVLKHTTKVDKMGFEMGVHLFQMRKDELNDNPNDSFISVSGHELLVKYAGQIETCYVYHEPGHKGLDCPQKNEQWPKLGAVNNTPVPEKPVPNVEMHIQEKQDEG